MIKIVRALLSVSNKDGLVDFARGLITFGVEILSTNGTARLLRKNGILVKEVSDFTGFPEIEGGRVKTLHPKIHGGLLGVLDDETHCREMAENGILPINMLVGNLYPFEMTARNTPEDLGKVIEMIDIGGPAMIRSAAKNHRFVTVVTNPALYSSILAEMRENGGAVSEEMNRRLARSAFQMTARYDGAIADFLGRTDDDGKQKLFGETIHLALHLAQEFRYGENPHQQGALYTDPSSSRETIQLHGKELSYNNMLDIMSAVSMMRDFLDEKKAVVAIRKHTTPCGVAMADSLLEAYQLAFECDPDSPFGGIVVCNRPMTIDMAMEVNKIFTEVLIAPGYEPAALELLKKKRDRRLMDWNPEAMVSRELTIRGSISSALIQEPDLAMESPRECRVVTKRQPTPAEYDRLVLAWKVAKHARSNAVVFSDEHKTFAIGSGSPSRVDAVHIAREKAGRVKIPLQGTVLASEAMFPYRDGIDQAAAAGAMAIIQPGGSIRDDEVVAAADEHELAMVFTSVRHFYH